MTSLSGISDALSKRCLEPYIIMQKLGSSTCKVPDTFSTASENGGGRAVLRIRLNGASGHEPVRICCTGVP